MKPNEFNYLIAVTLATLASACNSHLLLSSGDPNVVVISQPTIVGGGGGGAPPPTPTQE